MTWTPGWNCPLRPGRWMKRTVAPDCCWSRGCCRKHPGRRHAPDRAANAAGPGDGRRGARDGGRGRRVGAARPPVAGDVFRRDADGGTRRRRFPPLCLACRQKIPLHAAAGIPPAAFPAGGKGGYPSCAFAPAGLGLLPGLEKPAGGRPARLHHYRARPLPRRPLQRSDDPGAEGDSRFQVYP